MRYQWQLNGRMLPGANDPALLVPFADKTDVGLYTVAVMNRAGYALSMPAKVGVLIPPRITQQPIGGGLIDLGSTFSFSVQATGSGELRYQWFHNGLPIPNAVQPLLVLTDVQGEDSGLYAVQVTDDITSTVSDAVRLTVDALPDTFEDNNGFDAANPADGLLDRDGDGVSNRDEYRSGTDPADPGSYLRVESLAVQGGAAALRFLALAGRTYTIEYRDELTLGSWQVLEHLYARPATQEIEVTDTQTPSRTQRFYRLVTPKF
jgi:hypothetical protein